MDVRSPEHRSTSETSHQEDEESVLPKHHRTRSEDGTTDKHRSSSDRHSREGKSSKHKHKHHKHKHRRKHRKEHTEGSADEIGSDRGELAPVDVGVHTADDLTIDLPATNSRIDHSDTMQDNEVPKAKPLSDNSNLLHMPEFNLTDTIDDDKEEGEILDEEDVIQKNSDVDMESGEIETEVGKDEDHLVTDGKARNSKYDKTVRHDYPVSSTAMTEQQRALHAEAPGLESILGNSSRQRRSGEKGSTDEGDAFEKSEDDLKRKLKKNRPRQSRSPDNHHTKRRNRRSKSRERELETDVPSSPSKDFVYEAACRVQKHEHGISSIVAAAGKGHRRKRSRSPGSKKEENSFRRVQSPSEAREDEGAATDSQRVRDEKYSDSRDIGRHTDSGTENRLSREKELQEQRYSNKDETRRRSRSREAATKHDKHSPDRRSRETPVDYKDRCDRVEKRHRSRSRDGYDGNIVTRRDRERRSRSRESDLPSRYSKDSYQSRRRSLSRETRERSQRGRRSRSRERSRRSRSREISERGRRSRSRDTARDSRRTIEESERSKQSRSREVAYDSRDYRESRSRYDRHRSMSRDRSAGRDRRRSSSRSGRNSLDRRRSRSRTSARDNDEYTDRRRRSRSRESSPRRERHSRGEGYNRSSDVLRGSAKEFKGSKDHNLDESVAEDEEENDEVMAMPSEDEDVERIKEERRKRHQAIFEKYKKQEQSNNDMKESAGPKELDVGVNLDKEGLSTIDSAGDTKPPPDENASVISDDSKKSSFNLDKGPMQIEPPDRPSGTKGLGEGTPKSDKSADMFCDYIFGDSPAGGRKQVKGDGLALETSGLTDNWDDAEGYYCYRIGEVLDGRYEVASSHGRGVFSTVVRARDLRAPRKESEEVAIKIIRNNEVMFKSGQQELVILRKLADVDPENRRHCVLFLSSFEYRNHLCLVFESLHMNLREILKKFGRNIGINLNAVRAYAKQLFIALKHLRNCGVLHCDIKPDNMLVNEAKNVLKLCDFGSAMFAGENEITPYLVSRFYRAPEIILGLPYDHPLDMWSVGCCLYEFYTGKVLFPGPTNNDMLRLHMELKGAFPKKMLKKAAFAPKHFDQDFNFCAIEEDPVTRSSIKRIMANLKPKDIGSLVTGHGTSEEDTKLLNNFKDLLDKIFMLDPEKRITVSQALSHPFITGK